MSFINKNLTPLQRRTMKFMTGALFLTLLLNLSAPNLPNPLTDMFPGLSHLTDHNGHSSTPLVALLAALSALPILIAMWVAGCYLKAEPDEFIRALVVHALLWGFAVTMAGDAIAGVFMNFYLRPFPLSVLNADIFFVATGIAFRLSLRSYR